MARSFLKHEWRSLAADHMLWMLGGLLAGAIVYAAFNGAAHVRFQERTMHQLLDDQTQRFSRLQATLDEYETGRKKPARTNNDPRGASSLSSTAAPYLTLPRLPLAALSVGQSDLYLSYVKTGMRSRQMNASTDEIENPLNLLSGRFDVAFVVVYLLPLIILAVSYNVLSAEKEQGTLALTLSQPVSLRAIIAGKVVFRALVTIGLFVVCSMAATALTGAVPFTIRAFEVWIVWLLTVTIYGLFWFAVVAVINGVGKSSATNAIAAAGVWLALVLVIPSLINAAASAFYPVPSRVEMIQAVRSAGKEASSQGALLLSRYMEDHPDLMPAGATREDFPGTAALVQLETDRRIQPVLDRFERQSALQQAVVDRFRFLSPAILTQSVLNELSGSSAERYKRFMAQVDVYLRDWQAFFYPRIFAQTRLTGSDLGQAPRFQYMEETRHEALSRLFMTLGAVLAMTLAAAVLAFRLLGTFPVA
jgi:ABC-2 type transport system permease protein